MCTYAESIIESVRMFTRRSHEELSYCERRQEAAYTYANELRQRASVEASTQAHWVDSAGGAEATRTAVRVSADMHAEADNIVREADARVEKARRDAEECRSLLDAIQRTP